MRRATRICATTTGTRPGAARRSNSCTTMNCPACQRPLYNRRLERCGYCDATVPGELRFTPEEIAELDRKAEELALERRLHEIERKLDEANQKLDQVNRHVGWFPPGGG